MVDGFVLMLTGDAEGKKKEERRERERWKWEKANLSNGVESRFALDIRFYVII